MQFFILTIFISLLWETALANKWSRSAELLFRYDAYQISVITKGVANSDMLRGIHGSMPDGSCTFDEFYKAILETPGSINPVTTAGKGRDKPIDPTVLYKDLLEGQWQTANIDDKKLFVQFSNMDKGVFPYWDRLTTACHTTMDQAYDSASQELSSAGNDQAKQKAAQAKLDKIHNLLNHAATLTEYMEKARYADWVKSVRRIMKQQLVELKYTGDKLRTVKVTYGYITYDDVDIKETAAACTTDRAKQGEVMKKLGEWMGQWSRYRIPPMTVTPSDERFLLHYKALMAARGLGAKVRGIC